MTSPIWLTRGHPAGLTGRAMLYNALLSLIVFMFCLSLFLVHRISVLDGDIHSLRRDIILQLNQPRSDRVNGKMDKMSQTREVCHWLCRIKSSWTCTTEIYAITDRLDTAVIIYFLSKLVFSGDIKPSALQKAQSSLRTSLRRVKREQSSSGGGLKQRMKNVSISYTLI